MKIVLSDALFLPEEYRKRLEVLGNLIFFRICILPLLSLPRVVDMERQNMQVRVLPETDRSE